MICCGFLEIGVKTVDKVALRAILFYHLFPNVYRINKIKEMYKDTYKDAKKPIK